MTDTPAIVPWKRFWAPLGASISCDDDGKGFLIDPERDGWMSINANVSELGSLLDHPCLILLGEPGMGKSVTLKNAREQIEAGSTRGNSSLWIEFRDVPDTETFIRRTIETQAWKAWTAGSHKLSLVIDGLDEGLLKIPGFLSFLRAELETTELRRLQLILACRFADWPELEGKDLQALWPENKDGQKFELCPLRRKDVLMAAREHHLDENAFVQAVQDTHVIGLANRPVTLLMLLREFSRTGKLPGTYRDLYQAGCQALCREVDLRKIEGFRRTYPAQPRPSESQKFRAACRLAALLMLSGKSAYYTGEPAQAADTDLALTQVMGGSELVDGMRIIVNELLVWETATTALFSSRGENRLGFAHQTFMEALAAAYLKDLPLIQINRLLCQSDGYELHVVPQLTELAAWLAGEHDAFCEQLIAREPEVMLRTDVALLAADQKKRLVDHLLERAQNEEAFDVFGSDRFYGGLDHPQLKEQLLAVMTDKTKNLIARRMTMLKGQAKARRILLVIDESFFAKNPDALRTNSLLELRPFCKRCFVLCGTPAPNSYNDVVSQFDLADLGYTFAGHSSSSEPYEDAVEVQQRMDARGAYLRREKSVILPDLPPKLFHVKTITLSGRQANLYQTAKDDLVLSLRSMDNKSFRKNLMHYFQKRNALLQICSCPSAIDPLFQKNHAKILAVDDLLKEIIEQKGRKVLLWSFYRQNLDETFARYTRYNPVKIDGSTAQQDRRIAVDRFQNDPSFRLFIGNPAAAGAGLTLHAASDAIYMSFSNQAAHHLQSIDRIHRRGQTSTETNYHFIVCDNTIEVPELERLRRKEQNQSNLLGDTSFDIPDLDAAIKELSQ